MIFFGFFLLFPPQNLYCSMQFVYIFASSISKPDVALIVSMITHSFVWQAWLVEENVGS